MHRRPQFSLKWLMILIAIAAADFAVWPLMAEMYGGALWQRLIPSGLLILCYDILIYLVFEFLWRLIKPRSGDGPTWGLIAASVLVLTVCAGLPLVALLDLLLRAP